MNTTIFNHTEYDSILVRVNNNEYIIDNKQSIIIEHESNELEIFLSINEKNLHCFNLPSLLTGFIHHKDTWCVIHCDCSFVVLQNDDTCTISVQSEKYEYKERHKYILPVPNSEDSNISNVEYRNTSVEKVKKSHKIYNLLIPSLLPFDVLNLLFFVTTKRIGCLIGLVVCLAVFTIPSIVDISKFNKICDNSLLVNDIIKDKQKL